MNIQHGVNISEDLNLQRHRYESLKSREVIRREEKPTRCH